MLQICSVLYLFLLYASATLYSNLVSCCYRSVLYCIYFFCMPQQLCTVTLFHVVTDLFCSVFITFVCLSNSTVTLFHVVTYLFCSVFITFVCLSNSTVTLFHVVTDLLPVLYLFLLYASATLYSNLVSRCYRSVLYCIYFFCMPQQLCTVTLFHVVTDLFCSVFISFVCLSNSTVTLFHVVTDLLPVLYLFLLYASATLYSNLVSRCYRSVL